jgi:bifunctional DNA-binding transcriptional regulator/antitoxin component of YhaV-PrlF toxin-antitoxin module
MKTKQERLLDVVKQLQEIQLTSTEIRKLHNIKIKDIVLVKNIPEGEITDYFIKRISGCLSNIAADVQRMVDLQLAAVKQCEMELMNHNENIKYKLS